MSTLTDSIVTSHKEAAKRASTFLANARNLKLKPTEALELVAQVLGAANWQTLLGMANEGKAPRPTYQAESVVTLSEPAAAGAPSPLWAEDWHTIERLRLHYMSAPRQAHPLFTPEEWQAAGASAGYWTWVYERTRALGAMLPWNLDEMPAYRFAKAAGVKVGVDRDGQWRLVSQESAVHRKKSFPEEFEAWNYAAQMVDADCVRRAGASFWSGLEFSEKVEVMERRFYQEEAPGMGHLSRIGMEKAHENRAVCQAAGLPVKESPEDLPAKYVTADNEVFDSELAAYEHQASVVGTYVCAWFDWEDPEQWRLLPEKRKIKYAKRYAATGSSIYFHLNPDALRKVTGE